MSDRTGNLYRNTSLRNGGRRAGIGTLYDNYDDESGCKDYEHFSRVRFPHDDVDPEELNGPVIVIKKAKEDQ
jgi:hypothetical protein